MASSSSVSNIYVRRMNMEVDYEGPIKFCKCRNFRFRVKAYRWTSWTDENPGRRFYGCPNYEVKGCGYFQWHDPAVNDWVRGVINNLKWEKKLLIVENRNLKAITRGGLSDGGIGMEIDELWMELRGLKSSNVAEREKLKRSKKIGFVVALISRLILLAVVFIC